MTWIVVALLIVIADQLTKWAIIQWVPLYDRVPLNSFINLTHQKNTGAAFSILADAGGWQRWFFIVLATVISAVIAVGRACPGARRCCRESHRSHPARTRDRFHTGMVR